LCSAATVVSPVQKGSWKLIRTPTTNAALFTSGLTPGQSVRILSGPFVDFVGTLERLDDAGRVRVLLKMMGTAVPVALRRTAICPAA
jgi:transcriptional antiterminator RfaH